MSESIERPSHYASGKIECWEAMESAAHGHSMPPLRGYFWFNIFKYIWRWPKKNGLEDLKKARVYLDKLIALEEEDERQERLPLDEPDYTWNADSGLRTQSGRLSDQMDIDRFDLGGKSHLYR